MRKNVASQVIAFQMNSTAAGAPVTSGTPTVYVTIDGGAQSTGSGTSTHEGNGQWSYAPTQADSNGDHVAFTMALTNAISQTVNVYPVSFDPTNTVNMGLTAIPNAAADAAGGLVISDAGGLDVDALNTAAVRLTAARAQVLDDWINAGRLDLILDIIAADVINLDGSAMVPAAPTAAANADAVWDEAKSGHVGAGSMGEEIQSHSLSSEVATAQTDLDTITGPDGVTLATLQPNYAPNTQTPLTAAEVNAEVDTALNTAIPGSPTANSINERIAAVDDAVSEARMSELDAATSGKMANQVDLVKTEADKIANADAGAGVSGSVIEEIENVVANIGARTPSAQTGAPTTYDGLMYFIRETMKNRLRYTKSTDVMELFEDDGTTAKLTFTMTDDATEATRGAGT